jgi:cellulose synthase/poly-beta-1,6-N-acetylglucosamine synthase-like glycosyltransferase
MLSAIEWSSEFVLMATVFFLAIPAAVLLLQVMAPHRLPPKPDDGSARPRVLVLVPAHNEERSVEETLKSINAQLRRGDQVMVVADNCGDATADIARTCGALVVERHDVRNRGKGFAIDYGKRHIRDAGEFEVVILIDADCSLGEGAIELLSTRCVKANRPVQAAYMMALPKDYAYKFGALKVLAWRVKNYIRPLGGDFFGFPCQLMGSGMAFPSTIFSATNFATSSIVEDLKYGIDLAVKARAPMFCPQAIVSSTFPAHAKAMLAQRKRWEHGYLSSMAQYIPLLLWEAARKRRPSLLAMAADLAVPPLALLLLSSLISLLAAFAFFLVTAGILPVTANLFVATMLLAAVMAIWFRHGRDLVSAKDLCQLPLYVLSKLPLYASFVTGRQTRWIRTGRDDLPVSGQPHKSSLS